MNHISFSRNSSVVFLCFRSESVVQERIVRLETYLNVMLVKLDLVEHHLEHEMVRAIPHALTLRCIYMYVYIHIALTLKRCMVIKR